ncbi:MAG: hypothetical protein AB8G05_04120 [Oligoflexales bacterium]
MKRKIKNIYMDNRDVELLHYLFKVKVASCQQIHRDIYNDICFGAAGNRIRRLQDNKFIEIGHNRLIHHGKRTVWLKKPGFEEFVRSGNEMRIELKSDSINHDLVLVDIRRKFLDAPTTKRYRTENEIQTWGGSEKQLNSDAIVSMQIQTVILDIPIEYERSPKLKQRFENMVKRYYQKSDYPLVFVLAETQAAIEAIKHCEQELFPRKKTKFFYSSVDELLSTESPKLFNCHGSFFDLMQRTDDV